MVPLEKVDDAIIYELQIQRGAEEPESPSRKPQYFNREDVGSEVSHHPTRINRRRGDLSSTLIFSILSDSPCSPAEMISCVIKLLSLVPEFFLFKGNKHCDDRIETILSSLQQHFCKNVN